MSNHAVRGVQNPYVALLYEALSAQGLAITSAAEENVWRSRPDVWHFHWPTALLKSESRARIWARALRLLTAMHVLRLQGTKTAWTVHNLRSHEQKHPRLESLFMQCFVRSLDGAHFLSPSSKDAGTEQFPALAGRPHAVVPHGHYRTAYPDTVSTGAARDRLDLPREAQVLSFVGKIRPYKNVPTLIQTFRQCQGDALRLLVAGQPRTSALEDELRTAARRDEERVRLFLDFLPDEDLQLYLKAADLIVLPFERILNSGSALLGLSFDRPILVPHIGSMPDLQKRVGDQWVRTYSPPLTVGTLREALEWTRHPPRAERAPLNSLNWDRIAAATADFFERLCSQQRSRTVA